MRAADAAGLGRWSLATIGEQVNELTAEQEAEVERLVGIFLSDREPTESRLLAVVGLHSIAPSCAIGVLGGVCIQLLSDRANESDAWAKASAKLKELNEAAEQRRQERESK